MLKVKPATGNKIVALTFDDGPDDVNTPKILKILEENGVKATFFEMGSQVKKHPDLTRELVAAGMVVGNHSYSHPDLKRISTAAGEADIRRAQNAITSAAGSAPRYFRPPGGVMTTALMPVIAAMGLTKVMWTSDTYDWNDPPSIAIVHRALKRARDGGVILMHDGGGDRARTIAALPLVIRALKAEGYTMVTVDKLKRLPQKLGGF